MERDKRVTLFSGSCATESLKKHGGVGLSIGFNSTSVRHLPEIKKDVLPVRATAKKMSGRPAIVVCLSGNYPADAIKRAALLS
jgi:hypothetical protein